MKYRSRFLLLLIPWWVEPSQGGDRQGKATFASTSPHLILPCVVSSVNVGG